MRVAVVLLSGLLLAGCDQLTGAAAQKTSDAEAIGYACRVSLKTPDDCMKENETQSPSAVLAGWRSADEDVHDGKLDPSMGVKKEQEQNKPADAKAADVKPAEAKPEAEKKDSTKEKADKPDLIKLDKPKADKSVAEDKDK